MGQEQEVFLVSYTNPETACRALWVLLWWNGQRGAAKDRKKEDPLPQAPPLPEQAEAKGHNIYKKRFGPGEKVEPVPLVPK